MKKFRKLAIGFAAAGLSVCMTPAVAFTFGNEAVQVLAADESYTVEEGDSVSISANLSTDGYGYVVDLGQDEYSVLSQEISPVDESGSSYTLDLIIVINTVGTHVIEIVDGEGNTVKTVEVSVTAASASDNDAGEEGEENTSDDTQDSDGSDESQDDANNDNSADSSGGESGDEADQPAQEEAETELVAFLPITNGTISGTTESGEFNPGETITLKMDADKGYVLRGWTIRTLDGRNVTDDLNITKDNTFTIPDYPIRISAELEYILVDEIELLDVTDTLAIGKPVTFTGHVKDNTDTRFFLLAELWVNELDTKGTTSSAPINEQLAKDGIELLKTVEAGDKYNYSVVFMTTEGYEFADDVKLLYNGKEYAASSLDSSNDDNVKDMVTFDGFLSWGVQTNKPETKTTTKTVTTTETKTDKVTQYVYNTYNYTTYQYVTRVVQNGTAAASGNVVKTAAPATGDKNSVGVWIALAIAAGGGVVSGVLVGRRRKRNR